MRTSLYRKGVALALLVFATLAVGLAGQDATDVGDHPKVFYAAAVDGGYFVTGGFDKNVRLWKIDDKNNAVEILPPFESGQPVLAVAATDKYVVAGGRSGKVTVWRRSDRLVPGSKGFNAVAVDTDGKRIAFAVGTKGFVWDQLADPTQIKPTKNPEALAWGKGDMLFLAGGQQVESLDVKMTDTPTKVFDGLPKGTVNALASSDSGLLILDNNGITRRAGTPAKTPDSSPIGDTGRFAVSANGGRFVTAVATKLTVWDAGTKDKVADTTAPKTIRAVAVSRTGTVAAIVDDDKKARFWDLNKNTLTQGTGADVPAPDKMTRLAVHVSDDSKVQRIAAVTEEGGKATLLFRSIDGTGTKDPAAPIDTAVSQLAFSTDGSTMFVVGAADAKKVRRFTVADGAEGKSLTLPNDIKTLAVVSADPEIVVAGTDSNVFVLNPANGKVLATTDGSPVALAAGVDEKKRVRIAWTDGAATRRIRVFQYDDSVLTELQRSPAELKGDTLLGVVFNSDTDTEMRAKVGYVDEGKLQLWEPNVREAYVSAQVPALDPQGRWLLRTKADRTTTILTFRETVKSVDLGKLDMGEEIKAGLILSDSLVTASQVAGKTKGRLRIWTLSDSVPVAPTPKEVDPPIVALAPSPLGFVARFADGTLQRFDNDGNPQKKVAGFKGPRDGTLAGLSNNRFLIKSPDGQLQTWEFIDDKLSDADTGHGPVHAIAWRPGMADQFITAGGDGKVRGWEIDKTGKVQEKWATALTVSDKSPVYAAVFLDADRFATAGKDGTLRIYKTTDKGNIPKDAPASFAAGSVLFSLAARPQQGATKGLLAAASSDGALKVWVFDTSTLGSKGNVDKDALAATAFNADGNRLISINFRGKALSYPVDNDGKLSDAKSAKLLDKTPSPYALVGSTGTVFFVPAGDKVYRLEAK